MSVTIDEGTYPCFLSSFRINLSAAALLRLDWIRKSRTSPSASTAHQGYICLPRIVTNISSKMPPVVRSWREASEPLGIAVSELENPTTYGLVRHVEAALGQQILDVSEARREVAIEPYGVSDDLGRESVAAIADRVHRRRLDYRHSTRKPINVTAPSRVHFGGCSCYYRLAQDRDQAQTNRPVRLR